LAKSRAEHLHYSDWYVCCGSVDRRGDSCYRLVAIMIIDAPELIYSLTALALIWQGIG
jgi:hypothetical protein